MSAATQNYVEQLQKDLKEAREAIKRLEGELVSSEEINALLRLQESIFKDRLGQKINTAGNNGDLPGEMR